MKHLTRRILIVLCALTVLTGLICLSAAAEESKELRILTVEWWDEDNYDAIRPGKVKVTAGETSAELTAENAWTGELEAASGEAIVPEEIEGYTVSVTAGDITVITYRHPVRKTSVTGRVAWADQDNASGKRPDSVQIRLMANGQPYSAAVTVGVQGGWTAQWDELPVTQPGSKDAIVYTVEQVSVPEGYTAASDGQTVTNTIQTGRLTLQASVAGVPEGADASGLRMTISGPDPRMPMTVTLGELAGGSLTLDVVPGAYLVQENNGDSLVEGYTMDAANSRTGDSALVEAGKEAALTIRYAYKLPDSEGVPEDQDPMANVGSLTFEIIGPSYRKTVSYSEFVNGRYELNDLEPGEYTVIERNAETLVNAYTLTSASVTGMSLTVNGSGEAHASLFNQYVPAPTPEPPEEFINIPVHKFWQDNDNADGNRPGSVTVHLYANGAEVASAEISAAGNWGHIFENFPRYNDKGEEIVYSVNETPVMWYMPVINGYNITNIYQPEVTSVTAVKIWEDNNNSMGLRPASIALTLSNGKHYVVTEKDGWTVTVNNLPTRINGEPVTYSWTEQAVVYYTQDSVRQEGTTTFFTNKLWEKPLVPADQVPPKGRGDKVYVFDEYDTPLGVEVIINHVGDCFD